MLTVKWDPSVGVLLKDHAAKMPRVVRDVLIRLGILGTAYAKRITPVDKGRLRKSVTWYIPGAPEVHIGSNVVYAPIILADTAPFVIVPRKKKVLAWMTKGHIRPATVWGWREARRRGWARYAKRVVHPGGKDVLGKTEKHLEGKIPDVVASILEKYGITG
jgi:hypothetical protein